MAQFSYRARNADGNVSDGVVDAASRYEALSILRSRQLTVLSLEETLHKGDEDADPVVRPPRRKRAPLLRRGVPISEMATFCRQLAISVTSGVPLRDALESIAEDIEHPTLRVALADVVQRLHDGKSMSEAISAHRRVFNNLFIALIKTAEESGSMPQTLEHLAISLERSERLARKIKSITAYPIFVIVCFTIVACMMTLWVLPQFQESFAQLTDNAKLPPLTRMVFGANKAIIDHIGLILAFIVAVVAGFILYGRTEAGRLRIDGLKLKLPFFGDCIRKISIARICRNLAIMIDGGVPITAAIEIASEVSGNKVLETSLLRVRERIMQGADFSSSLAREKEFPRLVVRMVGVGEASGKLPDVSDKVAASYEDQVEGSIMVATSLFEPIVIVVFGAIILVLVLAIYMPVFSMGANVK
jgi:type IV pilus assembly protein PilC